MSLLFLFGCSGGISDSDDSLWDTVCVAAQDNSLGFWLRIEAQRTRNICCRHSRLVAKKVMYTGGSAYTTCLRFSVSTWITLAPVLFDGAVQKTNALETAMV